MKLALNGVSEGTYNEKEIHAFIQIKGDSQLMNLEPFQYRTYLNEHVLPVLKEKFKATSHSIHEFVYDVQGAPISLLISSTTHSNNLPSLIKSLRECITESNKTLCDFSVKNNNGFFPQQLPKEDNSELNSTHHNTI